MFSPKRIGTSKIQKKNLPKNICFLHLKFHGKKTPPTSHPQCLAHIPRSKAGTIAHHTNFLVSSACRLMWRKKTWEKCQLLILDEKRNTKGHRKKWGLQTTMSCRLRGLEASKYSKNHREKALIINPIYNLYCGYLLRIFPFKRLLGGLNS